MINKIVFDRIDKLTWHSRNLFDRKDQAEDYIISLKKKYKFEKCFASSRLVLNFPEDDYIILVVIVFKNEADEAEFILKECV